MRISLLLQREPFGAILERTLNHFWSEQLGHEVTVRWKERPQRGGRQEGQTWLVNGYLNAIFTANADRVIFDPIRREFNRSTVWWRRPAQQAYVAAALYPLGARFLAQATVQVQPAIPGAQRLLIVAGNHKIRLLNWAQRRAYGILKNDFDPIFMQRELAARQQAAALGIATPRLYATAHDGAWFAEELVSGTPLNRLADQAQAKRALAEAVRQVERLHRATAQPVNLMEYIGGLQGQIAALTATNPLLTEAEKKALTKASDGLARQAQGQNGNRQVMTAMAHGDFQPANILLDGERVWLIDWEYAGRRQTGYDRLVVGLQARFPRGLARRLHAFVAEGLPEAAAAGLSTGPGAEADNVSARRIYAALFLLEELALHLAENSQPLFTRLGEGLRILMDEVTAWTAGDTPA